MSGGPSGGALYGGLPEGAVAPGLAPQILRFCDELRAEGVQLGTAEILDAFKVLAEIDWNAREDFREALAATLAKSQQDRRVFELVFDRFFFRTVEAEAVERGVREHRFEDTGGERIDLDELRARIQEAMRAGREDEMSDLARLAVAAFGGQGESSGVIGVDVQRIRRALELRQQSGQHARVGQGLERENLRRFEQYLRRELERGLIERTKALPPAKPLHEFDRALPSGPLQDLAQVHRVVAQLKRRLATHGHEQRGRRRSRVVDVRRTMRASLETGGVPLR